MKSKRFVTRRIRAIAFARTLGLVGLCWGFVACVTLYKGKVDAGPKFVRIAGGSYVPLFKDDAKGQREISVKEFLLDPYPVTNGEYRAFVVANPRWQRSQAKKIFVDSRYLQSWHDDLTPTKGNSSPVTEVSWFAVKAYCQWQGKRLPTVAEWEYVALASETAADGRTDKQYLARILEWYARPSNYELPAVGQWKNYWGVYDMHGLVWEWVADFNSALVTGESRGDSEVEGNKFCGSGALAVSEKDRANYAAFMRYAFRSSLEGRYAVENLGFRCAKNINQ